MSRYGIIFDLDTITSKKDFFLFLPASAKVELNVGCISLIYKISTQYVYISVSIYNAHIVINL